MKYHILHCFLILLVLLCPLLLIPGCNVVRYAQHVAGPEPVEAQYVPARKPLVVIVKDQPDPSGARVESAEIADEIEQQLRLFDTAPLISYSKVIDLRSSRPAEFMTMSPARMGRAVGADQVLYVEIMSNTRDGHATRDMVKMQITARARMVDTVTGANLWPTDTDGAIVSNEIPLTRLTADVNVLSLERSLYSSLADGIAKLFRKYKPE